ncbi:TetR family transcriptional regulator [Ornithinibacillus gellani]|uniref:TetR/AcrR family transcriptional regulator n=1 Tax=Ornithinibacillus gellani TaxID=2293253 RepID=UPI000F4603EB|nr:TetR family transcriptional regulator [Ornithinibacillus gellani]TQS75766.1 TetR family transcriptional regulator [Ornithinibacillus gellani]
MAIKDKRQLIIEAATESFSLFGYKATTMDQVARLANVGKGTIYTFFENKEELFNEIVNTLISEMKRVAESTLDSDKRFFEQTNHVLYKILEFRKQHQLTIKLFQEGRDMGTPEVIGFMQRFEHTIIAYIKELLQKAIDKGEIKQCDPELTAFVMLKLYKSLIFDWELSRDPLEKEEIIRLFDLYFFEGLSI